MEKQYVEDNVYIVIQFNNRKPIIIKYNNIEEANDCLNNIYYLLSNKRYCIKLNDFLIININNFKDIAVYNNSNLRFNDIHIHNIINTQGTNTVLFSYYDMSSNSNLSNNIICEL